MSVAILDHNSSETRGVARPQRAARRPSVRWRLILGARWIAERSTTMGRERCGLRSVVGFFLLKTPLEDGGVERDDRRVDVHIGPQ